MGECTCSYYGELQDSLQWTACSEAWNLRRDPAMFQAHIVAAVQRLERERRDAQAGTGPSEEEIDQWSLEHGMWEFRDLVIAAVRWACARRLPSVDDGLLRRLVAIDPIVPCQRQDWDTGPLDSWRCVFCGTWSDVRDHVSHLSSCPWQEAQRIGAAVDAPAVEDSDPANVPFTREAKAMTTAELAGAAVPAPEPPAFEWPSKEEITDACTARSVGPLYHAGWHGAIAWLRPRVEASLHPAPVEVVCTCSVDSDGIVLKCPEARRLGREADSGDSMAMRAYERHLYEAGKAAKEQAGS